MTLWPLLPQEPLAGWHTIQHETATIDLADGLDNALQNVDGVSRRMAGQAERRGVVCRPSASAALGVTTYYGMLRESAERWGLQRPPFPVSLLDALVGVGGSDVEIWFAECDNHPIAGGVVLYGSQELFFWSAAMRHAFTRFRPSNALNVALIRAAAERGVRWYNLGASEGLPGVERFKRGLGAQSVPYSEIRRDRAAFRMYSRLRSSLRRTPAVAGRI
jgi:Acetyltransferase (GNAT) domain